MALKKHWAPKKINVLYLPALAPDLSRMALRLNPVYAREHGIEKTDDKIRILEFGPEGRIGHMLTVLGGRPRDGRRGSIVR